MDYPVTHPRFIEHKLVVRGGGLWRGAQLLYDGTPLPRDKGTYAARDDAGNEVALRFKINLGDPVPLLVVGDETVHLAKRLSASERVWICLPLLLLFIGGALGGVLGATGAYINSHIFRGARGAFARYALSGLVSAAAIFVFLVIATLLRGAIR